MKVEQDAASLKEENQTMEVQMNQLLNQRQKAEQQLSFKEECLEQKESELTQLKVCEMRGKSEHVQ